MYGSDFLYNLCINQMIGRSYNLTNNTDCLGETAPARICARIHTACTAMAQRQTPNYIFQSCSKRQLETVSKVAMQAEDGKTGSKATGLFVERI